MSVAKPNAIHAALTEALEGMRSAGQFRAVALADARGLVWAVAGDLPAPDRLAAVPSLIGRAFTDRQPLLRYFSDKGMRFEYRSDSLSYIKSGVEGAPSGTEFLLDVPGEKPVKGGHGLRGGRGATEASESREFIVLWDGEFLVLRHITVQDADWCLMGISPNPVAARVALQKGAPGVTGLLNGMARDTGATARPDADSALHARMAGALETFRAAAPEIHLAAVTSKDGFVVAALEGVVEADLVAPLIGHSFLAIQESTQRLCGATECVMLRMSEGILLARELTDDLLFAALLAPTACTGLILTAFETTATSLRLALSSMASSVHTPQSLEAAV